MANDNEDAPPPEPKTRNPSVMQSSANQPAASTPSFVPAKTTEERMALLKEVDAVIAMLEDAMPPMPTTISPDAQKPVKGNFNLESLAKSAKLDPVASGQSAPVSTPREGVPEAQGVKMGSPYTDTMNVLAKRNAPAVAADQKRRNRGRDERAQAAAAQLNQSASESVKSNNSPSYPMQVAKTKPVFESVDYKTVDLVNALKAVMNADDNNGSDLLADIEAEEIRSVQADDNDGSDLLAAIKAKEIENVQEQEAQKAQERPGILRAGGLDSDDKARDNHAGKIKIEGQFWAAKESIQAIRANRGEESQKNSSQTASAEYEPKGPRK